MKLTTFNTVNRSDHFDAIAINKKLEIETVKDTESNLRYFVVKNVLENPDKFVELMSKHNAYGGDLEVATPGYRQMISSLEIPTISKLYAQIFREFTDVDSKLSNWYYTTNIYHEGMVVKNNNNMPRFEPYPMATNLCLTKDPKCGLAFYRLNLLKKGNIRYNDEVRDMSEDMFKQVFPIYSGNNEETKPWGNFVENDYWKMYAFEKFEYNSAIIYDPLYFHQVFYETETVDSVHYALAGFLDSPIVKYPFWEMKENFDKKDETE